MNDLAVQLTVAVLIGLFLWVMWTTAMRTGDDE